MRFGITGEKQGLIILSGCNLGKILVVAKNVSMFIGITSFLPFQLPLRTSLRRIHNRFQYFRCA